MRNNGVRSRILSVGLLFFLVGLMNAVTVYGGTATLAWDPPTTNVDGTTLMDLAGYKIYYGTVSGNYTNTVDIGNRTTYQIADLTNGITYYFAVTAYNIYGSESGYSPQVSKTIPAALQYNLTATKTGTGAGTVTSSPAGIACGTVCSGTYAGGTIVILTAAPDIASTFSGWTGACTGTGACSVTMDTAKTVTASFALRTYTITASAGTGGNISPSGTVTVNHGASQTFTITPSAGYTLSNVLVDGVSVGAVSTYTFTSVTANHTISASFAANLYGLTVTKTGSGTGAVSSTPAGISCGSICSNAYSGGTIVTLTASPDASSTFAGWSGACTGTGACSVTMDTAKTVTASFALKTYTISASAGAGGSITPSGTVTANHGSNGTFTITPSINYSIVDVSVDGISVGTVSTYTFTNIMTNHTISASFVVNRYSLTVSKTGSGAGTVTSTPAGISCGTSCSGTYPAGTAVTLTASPDSNSLFNGWSGACTGTSACSVTMDAAKTVYPLFTPKPVFSLSCSDAGNPCVERVSGGSDADNLVNGKPKADVEYEFLVTVKDTGGTPQSVRFLTAQRSAPQPAELAAYPLTCSGDFGTGAVCAFRTKLGPAAVHRFFFEAMMSDGTTIMRYPQTGLLPGPAVKLLTGYNILSAPRDVNAAGLNGLLAFNSASTYRWNPDLGYYTKVTATNPVRTGEGYYSYNVGNVLPELAGYRDVPGTEYAYRLKAGWNLVSNPFAGNVRLADIKVQRGTAAPVTWQEATAGGWITNALYSYTGSDWGKTYTWESDVTAVLVPWMGYSVYLNTGDATYSLIIPKP